MVHRSATAWWWSENLYFLHIVLTVDTGTASLGCAGGSSSLYFFSRCASGRSRLFWAGEDFLGSGYPSRMYFWATARRAFDTD